MPPHGLDRFLQHDLLAVKTDPLLGKRLGNIATGHGPEETILIPRRPGEGQDETPEPFRDAVGLLAEPLLPLSPLGLELVGGAGARDPPRQDPPTLRHEAPETSDILVVNLLPLVHAELADLLPTIALPSLDHRHWSLPMFGPIVDSRTVPTLCFNLLQLPCRTRPQPSQQAGWSYAAHQVGTALERRLVLCRGRPRLFLPTSAPPEELDAVCHHFVLRPLLPFGCLPRALGQAPLDQGRSPFFQILFARLGLLPPGDEGDVRHLITTLSRLRGIAPIDGQIKAADRCPAWRVPELRVSGQISDKDDPVEVRHALRSLPFRSTGCGSRGFLRGCRALDPARPRPGEDRRAVEGT